MLLIEVTTCFRKQQSIYRGTKIVLFLSLWGVEATNVYHILFEHSYSPLNERRSKLIFNLSQICLWTDGQMMLPFFLHIQEKKYISILLLHFFL